MQSLRSLFVPVVLTTWLCTTPTALAQEPETPPEQAEQQQPEQADPGAEGGEESADEARGGRRGARRGGRRGGRRQLTVIEAGTVHPVSGPAIENGVILIQRGRILAIGKQGDLRLPPNTEVHRFPDGHVYPGLIDASTDAFCDDGLRRDGSLNGGSEISEGLLWIGERDDQLVQAGITTAYVAAPSGAQMPGQGAIVRPQKDGFELWEDREQAALQYRIADAANSSHPLQRQQKLDNIDKPFEGLDKYREAAEKFEKDLEKYEEDFQKYLDHHAKKNGKDTPKKADDKGGKDKAGDDKADEQPKAEEAKPTPPKEGDGKAADAAQDVSDEQFERALTTLLAAIAEQEPKKQEPAPAKPSGDKPAGKQGDGKDKADGSKKDGGKKDAGPERPKYPKKPPQDPAKDALLKVLDGELPLHVVAHRADELRAALRMQREQEIPLLVLEDAFGADRVADEIAAQGATVVLRNLLPNALKSRRKTAYDAFDPTALPKHLNDAGVPFAIATGGARLAPLLPLMAATAVGRGLPEHAALRAITLTPAEILGIDDDTGSLKRGKYADILVTDGPLFATDSRVLMVLSRGRTQYEAR